VARKSDIEHFEKRQVQERANSDAATDPAIMKLHLQLADRYAQLLAEIAPRGRGET